MGSRQRESILTQPEGRGREVLWRDLVLGHQFSCLQLWHHSGGLTNWSHSGPHRQTWWERKRLSSQDYGRDNWSCEKQYTPHIFLFQKVKQAMKCDWKPICDVQPHPSFAWNPAKWGQQAAVQSEYLITYTKTHLIHMPGNNMDGVTESQACETGRINHHQQSSYDYLHPCGYISFSCLCMQAWGTSYACVFACKCN